MRHLATRAAVSVLAACALFGVYAAASTLWQPPGTIGLVTDYGATARAVIPGSPAARAGIVAGDRIRLDATPFADRSYVSGPGIAVPIGRTITFAISHDGSNRALHLTAVPHPLTVAERAALLLQCAGSLIFIAVGATLIVLRPSAATWGFGLYCLLTPSTGMFTLPWPAPEAGLAATLLYDVSQNAGVAGLLLFVLEFPRRFDAAWRDRARRTIPLVFIALAAMTLYPDVANQLLARGARIENDLLQLALGATLACAVAILCDTYRRVARDERERLRWVLIGFASGLTGSYVGNTLIYSTLFALEPPAGVSIALTSLNALLPLAVAHAIVRHRVLEIRFVIRRALVFAAFTTILAAVFALSDYVLGTALEDFRTSRIIAAGLSLAVAFAFKWLEERADATIEAIFFRRRRAAEARLSRAADLLPQARSAAVIEATLVDEVVDAFELTSAAFFNRDASGGFRRSRSCGWAPADAVVLGDTDGLVLALRVASRPLDLGDLPWRPAHVPQNEHQPAIAVPVHLRDELIALALYGSHLDGGAAEPNEIALLERLANAAGIAFDHLDALRLREENERQRIVIADLTARLGESRATGSRSEQA
jgi:hypothetical protein